MYKELIDNIQGCICTGIDLVGIDDVTVELQLTFSNGVLLSVRAEKDRVYGPVISTEVRRLVAERLLDTVRETTVPPNSHVDQPITRPTHTQQVGYVSDPDEVAQLFEDARARIPNSQFVESVYEQYMQYGRITSRQAEALRNTASRTRWPRQ